MVRCKTGDILVEDIKASVNTVNCVGEMGRARLALDRLERQGWLA